MTPEQFKEWLCREMPAGTIIGDPAWWAPRIYEKAKAPPEATGAWDHVWLIEALANGRAYWWAGSDFTDDAAQAIRFAREEDADSVIREQGMDDSNASQHSFATGRPPAPPWENSRDA